MTAPTIIGTTLTFHDSNPNTISSINVGSLTPASGSNRKLYVFVAYELASLANTFTVDWGGTNVPLLTSIDNPGGSLTSNGIHVYRLLEASFQGSAQNLNVDPGITIHNNNLGVIAVQVQDADQVQADDLITAVNANSYNLSVTDSESLVLQALTAGGTGTYAIASPATSVATAEEPTDFRFGVGRIDDQSSGSVTLNASGTDTTRRAHVGIAIPPSNPSGGGGVSNPPITIII